LRARDRLIVALDLDTPADAEAMVERLGDAVSFYKIGYQLLFAGGLPFAERLARQGKSVFLDMKLHDIPNTVERSVAAIAGLGMTFLTVHAYPQTMRAAAAGVRGSGLTVLGVTVMTSYDDGDLTEAGYSGTVAGLVMRRADQAVACGLGGLILSPEEALAVRRRVGPSLVLVTPGVRPAGAAAGDQKRVTTPADAIRNGADHLVVGRPITAAADPRAVAAEIQAEIQAEVQAEIQAKTGQAGGASRLG
jgi:orotidine-5'-phosphate decarboxylase